MDKMGGDSSIYHTNYISPTYPTAGAAPTQIERIVIHNSGVVEGMGESNVIINKTATMQPTPTATMQPTPTATMQPTLIWYDTWPVPGLGGNYSVPEGYERRFYTAKLSYFWPPLGGINCDKLPDGTPECVYTADGSDFRNYVGKGLACPVEFPLGTIFEIDGDLWKCIDRGGAIVGDWLDLLYPYMPGYVSNWGDPAGVYVYLQVDNE